MIHLKTIYDEKYQGFLSCKKINHCSSRLQYLHHVSADHFAFFQTRNNISMTMLTKLNFHFKASQISQAEESDLTLAVTRVADEDVWSQYVTLPSGVVMLRDMSINDWK